MGLNFVVVRFVGEDVLDGVAVGLAVGDCASMVPIGS